MRKTTRIQQQSRSSVRGREVVQRLVTCVEAISYALLRQRTLSAIAIFSIVWLASLWLAAALAQAQESPVNEPALTVTRPAAVPPSIASSGASHLVLSMVDRSEIDQSALPNSATQLANPQSRDQHSAEKVLMPSNPSGTEFASLAALASAPSSSLLNAMQRKGLGKADTGSTASDNKSLVYQLGAINFVINGLPSSFSVSSAGSGVAGAR